MSKIIRTKTRAEGGITEAEKLRMAEHVKMWNARAFRTEPIEPAVITKAIQGIYAAAGKECKRVIIVDSPLVMAMAGGFSAAMWYLIKNTTTHAAIDAATDAAIDDATDATTRDATYDATDDAIDAATRNAADNATAVATRDATYAAIDAATHDATAAATDDAIDAATRNAADNATHDAAYDATRDAIAAAAAAIDAATRAATYDATDAATRAATDAATYAATAAATDDATYDATYAATYAAIDAATNGANFYRVALSIFGNREDALFGLKCATNWWRMYQGGNMWSAYECYLTAMRDIIGLDLPELKKYEPWEQASIHGGFRIMHDEFCIVSNFPEYIKIDEQNRPHCETGASHRWRDGWELYHWHGVVIPKEWVTGKKPSANEALHWENLEQRRAACEIVGWKNILAELNSVVIDEDEDPQIGTLLECDIPDSGKERFIQVKCGTGRDFVLHVPKDMQTALDAQAWMFQLDTINFVKPEIRT